jgi:NadR type nicotinamide-nucleotide adenylyltransferase
MKKKDRIFRVALTGPESTGKTTLAEALAMHFRTNWVKEHAREYLSGLDRSYSMDDILAIAREQLRQEQTALQNANGLLFSDTELILIKVWSEDVFNDCPDWIRKNILPYRYDLYLLTAPDIEWKYDPLRENPHRREFLFDWYERELKIIGARYSVISGSGKARLENAIRATESFYREPLKIKQ